MLIRSDLGKKCRFTTPEPRSGMDDQSKASTVAARTIGAVRSGPFTSSMLAIESFLFGVTVR